MEEYSHLVTYLLVYVGIYITQSTPVNTQDPQHGLPVYSTCSGQGLQRLEPKGIITSPGYPKKYATSIQCTWKIEVPQNSRVRIELIDLNMDGARFHSGCHDMLRFIDSKNRELERVCGDLGDLISTEFYVNDNKVSIKFRTYYQTKPGRGFKLLYSAVPCPRIPLSNGSFLGNQANTSATVICSDGAREPMQCVAGRWEPELSMLGSQCVDIVPDKISISGVTTANKTGYRLVDGPSATSPSTDNTGIIIGAIIGSVILLIVIGFVVLLFLFKKRGISLRDKFTSEKQKARDAESTRPLAKPDVILVPNYSEPVEGNYTEPVEVNTPDTLRKGFTANEKHYSRGKREKSPTKSVSSKSSTKSHHSYDLPYHAKTVDLTKTNGEPMYNLYDLPQSKSREPVRVEGYSEFYDIADGADSDNYKEGPGEKGDDNSSGASVPDLPAPPTPEPPPLPAPNRAAKPVARPRAPSNKPQNVIVKPKGPAPKPPGPPPAPKQSQGPPTVSPPPVPTVVSPYEDDPKPYACVDIITPGKPIVRTDSNLKLPEGEPSSVSSFQVPKKT